MFGIIVAILSILAFAYFTFRRQAGRACNPGKTGGPVLPSSSKCHSCESCRLYSQCDKIHRGKDDDSNKSLPILLVLAFFLAFFPGCRKKTTEEFPVQNEPEATDPYEIQEIKGYAILTDANFFVAVKGNDLLLVDCWMNQCPPCEAQAEILDQLLEPYQDRVKFAKYHHNSNGRRSIDYRIQMFPTLLLFKDGKLKEFLVGLHHGRDLRKILDAELAPEHPPTDQPISEEQQPRTQ